MSFQADLEKVVAGEEARGVVEDKKKMERS